MSFLSAPSTQQKNTIRVRKYNAAQEKGKGNCSDFSVAQWLRAPWIKGSAALVLGSILIAASLVTRIQQSGSSR